MERAWTLIGADGRPYASRAPGTLGGHRRSQIYGRLDCPGALRWIARGHYVKHRVFFADEATAKAAGYRPCARCLPQDYLRWRTATQNAAAPTNGRAGPGARGDRPTSRRTVRAAGAPEPARGSGHRS
jgi:hypothetical protein